MTVTDLLQSARFVVDTEGNQQAVQLNIAQWKELVTFLETIEAWEREWHRPFEAIRVAWDTAPPAPAEGSIPDDESLVQFVHEVRDETS
jgi:hypothetical protein